MSTPFSIMGVYFSGVVTSVKRFFYNRPGLFGAQEPLAEALERFLALRVTREALLESYRLTDRDQRDSPYFICEGRWVVEALLDSRFTPHSVLIVENQHQDLLDRIGPGTAVLRITQEEANALLGFYFHRGVLAAARQPDPSSLRDWLASSPQSLQDPRPWVIAPHLTDPSNLGALIRNAAALDAEAVILSTQGASPFYRKAIRASSGAVFRLPVIVSPQLKDDLRWLRQETETSLTALALRDDAIDLPAFSPSSGKNVILVGSEGHGLGERWMKLCHQTVRIPMARGMDSLNVATSAALMLHHCRSHPRESEPTPHR